MECQSISSRHAKPMSFLAALAAVLVLTALQALAQPANGVLLERWNNITGGSTVSLLTSNPAYPNSPSTRTYTTLYEIPVDVADNYGTRTRGYVTPPTNGNYTFWIAADDNAELWLSTDANPANVRRIAHVPGWTATRLWAKYPEQQSAAIALTAGTRYFIETRHKENVGGDNMAVGWQGPGITGEAERPIPASRLTPFLLVTTPVITTQPANATANLGLTATFSVAATGGSLSYQWRRNGADIAGATGTSYTTPPTVASDQGTQFSVVVSNTAGTVTSANAVLTVIIPPSITIQPLPQTVQAGQTATFSVTAAGTNVLTYQWRRNGANISGATSPTYSFAAATADNGVNFSVVVSNSAGTVTSNNALLTVTSLPVITTQPANRTVNMGQTAAFSVTATGSGPLSYQWRRNGASIPGATASTYVAPPTVAADNGAQFSVVVSNSAGSVTSAIAVLTVIIPPVISPEPNGQTVQLGQTALFEVGSTGTHPMIYQWRRNGVNIAGATASAYTTPATVLADNGAQFSVIVSNSAGADTSVNAQLTVVYNAPNNKKLAISGELVNAAGDPIGFPNPATVDVVVTLFNAASAGTSLYREEFRAAAGKGIQVTNGLFVARLGEGTTSFNLQQVLAGNASLWAEITIDDGSPDILSPRTPITAAGYSLGGTPAAAAATALQGEGDPNALGIEAAVGATWVNTEDNRTWFKLNSGWKSLE